MMEELCEEVLVYHYCEIEDIQYQARQLNLYLAERKIRHIYKVYVYT